MTSSLRIAHFAVGRCNPESANGVDKAICSLSRSQARLGHAVSVFSLTQKEPVDIPGVEVYCCGGRNGSDSRHLLNVRRFLLPERLISDIQAWHPDVLHLHSVHIPENIALGVRARRLRIPYGVTVHGGLNQVVAQRHHLAKLALKFLAEQRHLQKAAFVHAVSSRDAEGIRSFGLVGDISIVPNGFDLESIPERFNTGLLAERYPQLHGKRIFTFLGRIDAAVKGLDLLLRGFAEARTLNAGLVLIGPGEASELRALEMLSRRLGLTGSVVFAGPAYGQLKFDFLAAADVFVHPSRTEGGLPFSVVEAAAMSKPCLVTPAADPAGMLTQYCGGIAVAPESSSIAQAIARFSAMDTAELVSMGTNARLMVDRELNWEPMAARVVDCYRAACERYK